MATDIVKNWFGGQFKTLAPQIQTLHTHGGKLTGDVDVAYGKGLAGLIGKRLAKKLGIPDAGRHKLVVAITHHDGDLHWARLFDNAEEMTSVFTPVGNKERGFWIEKTGPLHIKLTVDIENGGWYWRCLNFSFLGVPLPAKLFPESEAYKRIENGRYRFRVGFKLWFLGDLLSYSGLLSLENGMTNKNDYY